MIEAVLFDWGDTLMRWELVETAFADGTAAGLAAIGREAPTVAEIVPYFDERAELFEAATLDEIAYGELVGEMFASFGAPLAPEELDRYLAAQHKVWVDECLTLGATTHALLESLRRRGLKLGLVSNAFDPPPLLHGDLERFGVAERIDFAVFSSEVGRRKPAPEIFVHALRALGVEPERAAFVGDSLPNDIQGAKALGMTTVQALWFRADDRDGAEPDFQAFTQMDVLNIVRRLNGEG